MKEKEIFIGKNNVRLNREQVDGQYIEIDGELFYKISNYDLMNPFFMSIVSDSDHWMFISSNGGLTAGRKNPDNALFPYYTDDVIHTSHEITGSKTILKVNLEDKTYLWEPFSDFSKNNYEVKRNIYKNIPGNKIIFEEINVDLNLQFKYSWMNSEEYGFIKKSQLVNKSADNLKIEILDGIQNILPFGMYQKFQNEFSTLADGYKKNELLEPLGIGIFSLSSIPSDKAEPSESLKATTVWSTGIKIEKQLLSSRQLNIYRTGQDITNENDIKAAKGAYFIKSSINLDYNQSKDWLIVAELNQDLTSLAKIKNLLSKVGDAKNIVEEDIKKGTDNLIKIVASADGLQISNDNLGTSRHFANVLFNNMRGGIFDDSYQIAKNDFIKFLQGTNKLVFQRNSNFINRLNEKTSLLDLKKLLSEQNDRELTKLAFEYLPITFSRRHGDPSRPWNRFSIDIKNSRNERILNYQGNWRDLFQNWEALAISYPDYLVNMITKFLNASTADGYNPYRVSRNGFDWESPEADMPWANIGYWGDHQIIYLLKLLELAVKYDEKNITSLMTQNIFAYALVPYKIKSYKELLNDPQNTIDFDNDLNKKIIENELKIGTDARFISKKDGSLYQVNLTEKLLVPLLAKLTNFIPHGGIWLNTQRPEWNDANNALVGSGVSMVTLYYIKRYVSFCIELFSNYDGHNVSISEEVFVWLSEINTLFKSHEQILINGITDKDRKTILDGLGVAGEKYRAKIYSDGFSQKEISVELNNLLDFFNIVNKYIDDTITVNRRSDGLYHSYNLMSIINDDKINITHLYEMLEGQVAVLSSGLLSIQDSLKLLKSLKSSKLYREDQNSYILYPDRQLPFFIQKNTIAKEKFNSSELLKKLVEQKNEDIVLVDINGDYHFNGEIRNAKILKHKLENLTDDKYSGIVKDDLNNVLAIYESVFNHKYFTGRSGTFYKYEGLGSIYWHMVSKLLLAVQEVYIKAQIEEVNNSQLSELKEYYYEIKAGIGVHKSPTDYGAFPTDPYSHTPSFSGVQQPGMTGQVKEDIISRFGELGINISDGSISFNPSLLQKNEFLMEEMDFNYLDVFGSEKVIKIKKGSLSFTYCQVPFIYSISNNNSLTIIKSDGLKMSFKELQIDKNLSKSIFRRTGEVDRVEISINYK